MNNIYVYDVETAKNFFSVVASEYGSEGKGHVFEISSRNDDSVELKQWLETKPVLIGYNNDTYDNPLIVAASRGYSNLKLYNLSKRLIESEGKDTWTIVRKYKYEGKSIDLIRMLFSKKLRVGLKSLMITLKWQRVQDLPFSPEEKIPESEFDNVLDYNYNDVMFTKHLAHTVRDELNLRVGIEKQYGLDVMSKDGVATGIGILFKMIGDDSIRDKRTHRPELKLRDCIVPTVKFDSPEFSEFTERMKSLNHVRYSEKVQFAGKVYSYGIGGLHTEDESGIYTAEDDEVLIDADVTSYYPSLIIKYGLRPEHLTTRFNEVYEHIFNQRVEAKRSGDKLTSDTFKLALNGTFGNINNEYSWLYDPKMFFTITLSGQLLLSMLCEQFVLAGFEVLSANTDGVTARVKKSRFKEFVAVCRRWEATSRMNLEYTLFSKIIRRDVNCYYAVECDREGVPNGSVKEKGAWVREPKLGKGYKRPIENIALYEYFINNTPVEQTIQQHTDIYDFCMAQRVGKQFRVEWKGQPTQRVNRYYASTSPEAGDLIKIKDDGSMTSLVAGQPVMLFNDFVTQKDYMVDYSYYIREVNKIIDSVEHKQYTLF